MITSRSYASLTRLLAAAAIPAILIACGGGTETTHTTSTGTGGSGGNGGTGGGGAPPVSLSIERWGTRIWGPILKLSRTDRTLWFGTRAVIDRDGVARGGLGRLDIDSGEVKVFDAALPQVDYDGDNGPVKGPIATAGVVQDGDRMLVAARTEILVIGPNGDVTEKPIAVPGGNASPTWIALDRSGGRARLWAATDAGLVRMNADTFAVEQVYGANELGSINVGSLAIDPASGAVYLAVYGAMAPSLIARVDDNGVKTLVPGSDGAPAGTVGDIVWSAKAGAAVIAFGSWDPAAGGVATWDGASVKTLASEGQLATAARGSADAFGAAHLAVDDTDGLVIVGGSIQPQGAQGFLAGGGLAWIDLQTKGIAGLSTGTSDLPGDDIGAVTYDPKTRRTYIVARQPCNEHQLGNLGLVAVSFRADGSARFERPVISGVRSMAVVEGEVYLGLRDDLPGLSCFGFPVQTGLVRLTANRAGEIVPLRALPGGDDIVPFAGPTAMSVSDKGRFAIGTFRDGTFIGAPEGGHAFNQAFELNVSLYENDIAWASSDTVWIAGSGAHDPADPLDLADVGPRGAAMVKVGDDGAPIASTHYVLASTDTKDVTGLPSSEVAAIAIAADGTAYLACGTERLDQHGDDRAVGDPFVIDGKPRLGGVIAVSPMGEMMVLAKGEALPDPRGVSVEPNGEVWVLDAQKGLLQYIEGGFVQEATPEVPAGAYPRGLWRGKGSDVAALYDKGALISLRGARTFINDVGFAWRAVERVPGFMLIGTDQGLVRVRAGVADIVEPAVEAGALPAYKP